jgi:hypothetical protein
VVIVAVYLVLNASGAEGVNVAMAPLTPTVPETPLTVKLAGVTEAGATASLKVALTEPFTATPVALPGGLVEVTAGGAVSVAAAVVNDHE